MKNHTVTSNSVSRFQREPVLLCDSLLGRGHYGVK